MLPQNFAGLRHKVPGLRHSFSGCLLNVSRIVMIRYEADLLTVRFVCHRQPGLFRDPAYLLLRILPRGHKRVRKLFLRQIIQCVSLILSGCRGIADGISAIRQTDDSCIMSRGNIVCADLTAPAKHGFPLHIPVTGDTWIGRSARQIFLHEIIHDAAPENIPEVHHIVRDIQHLRHPARIRRCTRPVAVPAALGYTLCLLLPHLHSDPGHIISLLFQKIGCHRRIHTAGHAYHYFFLYHNPFSSDMVSFPSLTVYPAHTSLYTQNKTSKARLRDLLRSLVNPEHFPIPEQKCTARFFRYTRTHTLKSYHM